MALIVQKFGGSSLGTLDRIQHVANKVLATRAQGHSLVVVVSAMSGETDRLIRLANAITHTPSSREYDVLISTGEQVSMALLSIALNAQHCDARSFTGTQIGIQTDDIHTKARILEVKTDLLHKELKQGRVVIVAGFQGVSPTGEVTTLGRGGSDTTAVAIAAALKADECQIYTDVDGVYTTDPHMLPEATLIPLISFEEMLEMASLGAKVLQMRSVELASKHSMPIRVLSTFIDGPGTLVTFEDKIMQKRLVTGIAFSREEAVISLSGITRRIGLEGIILERISQEAVDIDMIAQNATAQDTVDFTFTVPRREYAKAIKIVESLTSELGDFAIKTNNKVAKVSLVGIGMKSHSGVASTMFNALGSAGVEVQMVTTSEIKISVIIDETLIEQAVKAIHEAFELHKIPSPTQARLVE